MFPLPENIIPRKRRHGSFHNNLLVRIYQLEEEYNEGSMEIPQFICIHFVQYKG